MDLWQVKSGTIFDDILITDDVEYAKKALEGLKEKQDGEKKAKEEQDKVEKESSKEEEKKAEESDEDDDSNDEDEKESAPVTEVSAILFIFFYSIHTLITFRSSFQRQLYIYKQF